MREARASGETLAEIAEEKGLIVEELTQKILESRKVQFEQFVEKGKKNQETTDQQLQNMWKKRRQ